MSKPDAERALKIYRAFVKQTEQVVRYLSIARHYDHATRLEIPKIKHAPTGLTGSLEEYLKDPDFDINRRQYLAQQESKKSGKATNGAGKGVTTAKTAASSGSTFPEPKTTTTTATVTTSASKPLTNANGPTSGMVDYFESIEQNQQPMSDASFQQPQFTAQTGPNPFLPQSTGVPMPQQQYGGQALNPFLQMQQQQMQQQQQQMQQQQQIQQMQQQHMQQQQQQQQHMQQAQIPQQMPQQGMFTGNNNFSGGFNPQGGQPARFASTLSSIPQSSMAQFQSQPQQSYMTGATDSSMSTNPFRQSMLASSTTGTSFASATSGPGVLSAQPTNNNSNPFAKPVGPPTQSIGGPSPFASASPATGNNNQFPAMGQQQAPGFQQASSPAAAVHPAATNPFAKPAAGGQQQQQQQQQAQQGGSPFATQVQVMMMQATGSTNPFRQSAFVNPSTGLGWQNSAQGTIGGLPSNQVETVPVFPRPGMG
jgi:hypothetical protein